MRPRVLNLLQHPRPSWVGWQPALGWALLGAGLALLAGGWLQAQRAHWQQEHRHWKAQMALHSAAQQRERQAREHAHVRSQQQALWRSGQAQQQRVLALQEALQREADQGLRLTRWQADGQHLWLHGLWPQAESGWALQARLSQVLGQDWTLHSMGTGPHGVAWSLQTPWPLASAPGAAP
ncbi:MAG: hypothetical protein FJY36_04160 [Betaproteobacteria bacterium]|nr:hypothetical protein [Betaproteobacteria bacterium]